MILWDPGTVTEVLARTRAVCVAFNNCYYSAACFFCPFVFSLFCVIWLFFGHSPSLEIHPVEALYQPRSERRNSYVRRIERRRLLIFVESTIALVPSINVKLSIVLDRKVRCIRFSILWLNRCLFLLLPLCSSTHWASATDSSTLSTVYVYGRCGNV